MLDEFNLQVIVLFIKSSTYMIYSLCIFLFAFNKGSIPCGVYFHCKSAYNCINLLVIAILDLRFVLLPLLG